jgi:hypothetical protein
MMYEDICQNPAHRYLPNYCRWMKPRGSFNPVSLKDLRFMIVFEKIYFVLKNLVLWAKPVPHCGSQSPLALSEESLQEFEVN